MSPRPSRKKNQPRSKARVTTAIRFPEDVHARLTAAAEERGLSMNYLVVHAVEELLGRLLPVGEIKFTR